MPELMELTLNGKTWLVNFVDKPQDLVRGLSGKTALTPDTGMLFDMGQEQYIVITTEEMLFPIDIVLFNGTYPILKMTENFSNVQPGLVITSGLPARYFLEVNAGELL